MADEIQRLWIDPPTPIRMAAGVGNVYSVTRYCDPGNGARMPPDSEGVSGLVGCSWSPHSIATEFPAETRAQDLRRTNDPFRD